MSARPRDGRRIVAAFDPYAPGAEVLRLALRLRAEEPQRLHALYVEEVEALALGSLPWAREVTLATGQAGPVRAAALEREVRQRAAAARALFESVASGLAGAQFEQVRGRLARELVRLANDASAVLLDWPTGARRSQSWARAVTRALLEASTPLVGLVAAGSAAAGILVVQAGTAAGRGQETARLLAAASRARVALQQGPVPLARVLERAHLEHAGTLLIERGGIDAADEFLVELALRWPGSLFLLR